MQYMDGKQNQFSEFLNEAQLKCYKKVNNPMLHTEHNENVTKSKQPYVVNNPV